MIGRSAIVIAIFFLRFTGTCTPYLLYNITIYGGTEFSFLSVYGERTSLDFLIYQVTSPFSLSVIFFFPVFDIVKFVAMIAKLVCCVLLVSNAFAALECSTTITPTNSIKPSVASGYRAVLVATGLTEPRSIKFDTAGNLLVVESGRGIISLVFRDDNDTCLSVRSKKTVIQNSNVNTHSKS